MSESNDHHDELNDALTDRLLAEAIGGETPPDLRDAILERASTDRAHRASYGWRRWTMLATAAGLMLAVTSALLLPDAMNKPRQVGKLIEPVEEDLSVATTKPQPTAPQAPQVEDRLQMMVTLG